MRKNYCEICNKQCKSAWGLKVHCTKPHHKRKCELNGQPTPTTTSSFRFDVAMCKVSTLQSDLAEAKKEAIEALTEMIGA